MPIPVTCQCGQSFAAGDHLAGRTVQCPKCKNPLTIPGPQATAPTGAPQPFGGGPDPSIFDHAGMAARVSTGPTCPSCKADLAPNAILCVKCGYHLQMGRRIGEGVSRPMPTGDGHSDAANEVLYKAARLIDENREAEIKQFKEGAPWWLLAGIFLLALTFLGAMLYLPSDVAFAGGGLTIAIVCWAISMYHWVKILIIAFSDNIGQGLACLLCGIYLLVYCFMHWDECGAHLAWYFIMALLSNLVGGGMMAAAPYMAPKEDPNAVTQNSMRAIIVQAEPTLLPRPFLKAALA